MPYIRKREREGQQWMTLPEVLAHIQAQGHPTDAWLEVRSALIDGEIPTRWEADEFEWLESSDVDAAGDLLWRSRQDELALISAGSPPNEGFFWYRHGTAPSDGRFGDPRRIVDPRPEVSAKRFRVIYLLRDRVLALWPASASPPSSAPKALRKPASLAQILMTARKVYSDAGNKPPNLTKAERAVRDLLSKDGKNAARPKIREVLKRKEFESQRRKRGLRY